MMEYSCFIFIFMLQARDFVYKKYLCIFQNSFIILPCHVSLNKPDLRIKQDDVFVVCF